MTGRFEQALVTAARSRLRELPAVPLAAAAGAGSIVVAGLCCVNTTVAESDAGEVKEPQAESWLQPCARLVYAA